MEKVIQLTERQTVLMQEALSAQRQMQEQVNLLGQAYVAGSEFEELEGEFNFDSVAKTLTITLPDEPEDPEDA